MNACDSAAVKGIKATTTFGFQLILRFCPNTTFSEAPPPPPKHQHHSLRRRGCSDVCGDPEVRGRVPEGDAAGLTGHIRWRSSAAGAGARWRLLAPSDTPTLTPGCHLSSRLCRRCRLDRLKGGVLEFWPPAATRLQIDAADGLRQTPTPTQRLKPPQS